MGRRLRQTIRVDDFVGRYGGEEFAIVLTNVDLHEAQVIAERLRTVLHMQPCRWENAESSIDIPVTASIGIALYRTHGITREALIASADRAMYDAKHGGRNRVCSAGEESMLDEDEDTAMLAPGKISPADVMAVQALTAVARVHDNGTSTHAQRMVYIAEATARTLGRSEEEVQLVRLAALLHDIGKINIPDEI